MAQRFAKLFNGTVRNPTDGQKPKVASPWQVGDEAESAGQDFSVFGLSRAQMIFSQLPCGPHGDALYAWAMHTYALMRVGTERETCEALLSSIFSHEYVDTYPPFPELSKESSSPIPPKIGKPSSGSAHTRHTQKSSRFDKLFAVEAQGPVQGEAVHHPVGSTFGERLDFGEGQLPQVEPSSLTGPTERSEVGTQPSKGPRFRLTPPDAKSRRADDTRPAPVVKAEILGTTFEKMYALCFRASNAAERRLLTKAQTGRVASVLRKLVDAGADVSRLEEFGRWWSDWAKTSPSPENVREFWLRAMHEIDEANKPPERTSPYPVRNHDYELTEAEAAEIDAREERGREIMGEGQ